MPRGSGRRSGPGRAAVGAPGLDPPGTLGQDAPATVVAAFGGVDLGCLVVGALLLGLTVGAAARAAGDRLMVDVLGAPADSVRTEAR